MTIFHALVGDAVAFGIAVGNIVFHEIFGVGADNFAKEGVQERDCGSAVDVVVAVDEDFLIVDNGIGKAFDGLVHVFHQEGVVKFCDVGVEEFGSRLGS